MSVKFTDNSDAVLEAFDAAVLRALERCGSTVTVHDGKGNSAK